MKKSKYNVVNKTKVKKKESILYKYFIAIMLIGLIHYCFFESHYIGSDNRYDLFVFWLPVLMGMCVIVKFNLLSIDWKDILPTLKKEKNIFYKIIFIPILLFVHFMLSVIVFWIPSNIVWDTVNKIESNKNPIETFVINVESFQRSTGRGSSNKINFMFKGTNESVKTSYQDIEPFLDRNPKEFKVVIEVKKGIWNYYVLQSWHINEVSN